MISPIRPGVARPNLSFGNNQTIKVGKTEFISTKMSVQKKDLKVVADWLNSQSQDFFQTKKQTLDINFDPIGDDEYAPDGCLLIKAVNAKQSDNSLMYPLKPFQEVVDGLRSALLYLGSPDELPAGI